MHITEFSNCTTEEIAQAFADGLRQVVGDFFASFDRQTVNGRIGSTSIATTVAEHESGEELFQFHAEINQHIHTLDVDIAARTAEETKADLLTSTRELGKQCGRNRLMEYGARFGPVDRQTFMVEAKPDTRYVLAQLDQSVEFADKAMFPFITHHDGANIVIRNPIDRQQRFVSITYSEAMGIDSWKPVESKSEAQCA